MSLSFSMAFRYAWGRRSALSLVSRLALAGLILSISVLVFVVSVVNGFDRELRQRVLSVTPHITAAIESGITLANLKPVLAGDQTDGLQALAPVIQITGLVAANSNLVPVQVTAMQAASYAGVSSVGTFLRRGDMNALHQHNFGIVIGAGIAQTLSLQIGDSLVLLVPGGTIGVAGAIPRQRRFEVLDVFASQSQLDSQAAFISLSDGQRLMRMGNKVHGVQGRLDDLFNLYKPRHYLQQAFLAVQPDVFPVVTSWMATHGNLYQAVAVQKVTLFLLFSLLVGVAAFNLVSGLMMMVEQRKADIAILRSMGSDGKSLLGLFCLLGLLIGLGGTLFGVLGGLTLAWIVPLAFSWLGSAIELQLMNQYFIYYLPVDVQLNDLMIIVSASITVTLLASLYPAWRSTRLLPSRTLANE